METFTKIDDNTIEVEKVETTTSTTKHTYEFLVSQKEAIEKQKAEQIKARDAELLEIDTLLAECAKLGVKAKSVEDVVSK